MPKKVKLLFLYIINKDIIKKDSGSSIGMDFHILKKHYDMVPIFYGGTRGKLMDMIRIMWGVLRTDVNFSEFAYVHAYYAVKFSKILKKKSLVHLGGFDVAEEETFSKKFDEKHLKRLRYILNNADRLIPCSEVLRRKAERFTTRKDMQIVHHISDPDRFRPKYAKENLVITAGTIRKDYLWRKGLMTFVRAAKYLPGTRFLLIGRFADESVRKLKAISPPNVEFTGYVSGDRVVEYMQKAKVYVQVSYHEGFGQGLAEAMLCECVPVVTRRGAIPEVVGDIGYYVPYDDPKATAEAIGKALTDNERGGLARERIKAKFPFANREKELTRIINSLVEESNLR